MSYNQYVVRFEQTIREHNTACWSFLGRYKKLCTILMTWRPKVETLKIIAQNSLNNSTRIYVHMKVYSK